MLPRSDVSGNSIALLCHSLNLSTCTKYVSVLERIVYRAMHSRKAPPVTLGSDSGLMMSYMFALSKLITDGQDLPHVNFWSIIQGFSSLCGTDTDWGPV